MTGGDPFADQGHDAGNDLVLAVVAVGKVRIISDIYVMCVRTRADDLAQHCEAAKAGIENKNRLVC
jgi:hypothetical protein